MKLQSPGGKPRVLVFERMDPTDESLRWLEQQGLDLTRGRAMWEEPYSRYSEAEIVSAALGHVAVMGASGARFTAEVIRQLPDLRFISKFGVGVDTIDLAAATDRGILVSNTPEESEVCDVAEHTIALILGLKKQLLRWNSRYMADGGWRPGPFAESLAGSTIGLVGLGQIGLAVAHRLAGWQAKLLGFDPRPKAPVSDLVQTDLTTLLRESDIVSLHASPSAENHHLINQKAIAQMKPTGLLINTARASLVDTQALCAALRAGRLAGAAVDVYDLEPPDPRAELFTLPNVIATPHAAAWTRKGLENIGWHAARNLLAMLTGQGHVDLVNTVGSAASVNG